MTEQDYLNRLFIRTYNTQLEGHQHPYHQVLIPLSGSIYLMLETKTVQVNYGEVYIIPKHRYHQFKADQLFRFLVINLEDIDFLPMQHGDEVHDFLDDKTLCYLNIIEKQLMTEFNETINDYLLQLLIEFLRTINVNKQIDSRLLHAISVMKKDIGAKHSLASLANIACLSQSQFKKLFKQHLDITPKAYLASLRMQMARGLIINTDMPIAMIAEKCGYQNCSAFIRRFSLFYYDTPQNFRAKRQ